MTETEILNHYGSGFALRDDADIDALAAIVAFEQSHPENPTMTGDENPFGWDCISTSEAAERAGLLDPETVEREAEEDAHDLCNDY